MLHLCYAAPLVLVSFNQEQIFKGLVKRLVKIVAVRFKLLDDDTLTRSSSL